MSTRRMERVFPLLMTVLMIATAFIPAVSAAEPNTSNVDTTSWINTSAEIESAGEPGADTSPATDITRVVTGSGKIRLKTYDPETGTIRITDESRSAADGDLEIHLVNTTPDLGTFTEIFEITAHSTIALDESEDFRATWALHNGKENATRAEWFVWENRLHTVEIPIIEYRNVTLEINTSENRTFENVTRGETLPETATVREPYIAGTETREQYWYEWVPFDPAGQTLNAEEARTFKVVYTKPAEIGQVDINTAPVFRGVACPEMTWWNTAWTARVPITITNPPAVDNYSHCEVVSFLPGMQSDFDDVRFATDDGTVLDYWKESYTASDSAVIWVNLPAGVTLIWMYYGNAAATDTGSRDNAYILYDDFNGPDLDTTIWTDTTPGAHYFSNGWIYDDQSRSPGGLISNDYVITDGEPVIVEMHIHADSLASSGWGVGSLPGFSDTVRNGLDWYPQSPNWCRRVFVNGVGSWRPGPSRGLAVGGDYYSTWIITPSSQTHTVSGSASYTDVFAGTTGISNHHLQILWSDNTAPGRVVRMDWIRARKYVETEPTFAYGTPETYLTYSFCAEWVGDYHGMQTPLFSAEEEAEGFYDTLEGSSSWTGQFINGNDAAMERHWKDPAFGGEDSDYIDNTHLAFFVGHGWDGGFVFGTAADDYELNYSEARWGNTKTDWIILGSCSTLNESTREHWEDAFEGLHSICGFDTTGAAHPDMGWYFAQQLMRGKTIWQAWSAATDQYVFPNDGSLRSAILAADIDGDLSTHDCLDDHIYGYGSSTNPPGDPPAFQYVTKPCIREI